MRNKNVRRATGFPVQLTLQFHQPGARRADRPSI
jgi:hypothetical protein